MNEKSSVHRLFMELNKTKLEFPKPFSAIVLCSPLSPLPHCSCFASFGAEQDSELGILPLIQSAEVAFPHPWKHFCLNISPPVPRTQPTLPGKLQVPGFGCRAEAPCELSNLFCIRFAVNWKRFTEHPLSWCCTVLRQEEG